MQPSVSHRNTFSSSSVKCRSVILQRRKWHGRIMSPLLLNSTITNYHNNNLNTLLNTYPPYQLPCWISMLQDEGDRKNIQEKKLHSYFFCSILVILPFFPPLIQPLHKLFTAMCNSRMVTSGKWQEWIQDTGSLNSNDWTCVKQRHVKAD